MALPLKGIAGKRNKLRPLIAAQGRPVDIDARGPELPEREQEGVAITSVLHLVAHEPNGTMPFRPLRVTDGGGCQDSAGTHLDEDPARIGQQGVELVGKPYRRTYLAGPRCGLVASPGANHVPVRFDSIGICGS